MDWQAHDPGTGGLLLVGPVLPRKLPASFLTGLPQLAIDGGIHLACSPFLWTGDGDSGCRPAAIPAIVKTAQDETDLGFTLRGIRGWKWQELHLAGFLGERRDHELANIGEIHAAMKSRREFTRAVFYGATLEPEVYFFREGRHSLDIHGIFSVMALEPAEAEISGGCDYRAERVSLEPLSGRGVSNRGHGRVEFICGKPFMVLVFPAAAQVLQEP